MKRPTEIYPGEERRARRASINAQREFHRESGMPCCTCVVCVQADTMDMIEQLGLGVGVDLKRDIEVEHD